MKKENKAFMKPLLWAYSAVGAFTAISIAAPLLWERLAKRADQRSDHEAHKRPDSRQAPRGR
jgi:hypothetical protein